MQETSLEWMKIEGHASERMRKRNETRNIGRRRIRRDENESVRSAFGRGVGFYIGEPCESTCNNILFHVYCNRTSGKCECHDRFPVNIENKICVRVSRLDEPCEWDQACAYLDDNAICYGGICACADGFRAAHKGTPICLPGSTVTFLESNYLMTTVGAVAGLVLFTALLCIVLKLFSKSRISRPRDRMASAGSPPTMLSAFTGSRVLDSRRSSSTADYLPTGSSRRASYSVLHLPPSSMGSRRASSTSVRSQLSFRTSSSFRGYRTSSSGGRAGRPPSSPADSSRPPTPPCPAHHHHHRPPIHHNSPVDEDDSIDDSLVSTVTVNHLSNHI